MRPCAIICPGPMPGSWPWDTIMPWGIMPGPMLGPALGEGIWGAIPWDRGWEPMGVMPSGLRAGMGPELLGPIMRGLPW